MSRYQLGPAQSVTIRLEKPEHVADKGLLPLSVPLPSGGADLATKLAESVGPAGVAQREKARSDIANREIAQGHDAAGAVQGTTGDLVCDPGIGWQAVEECGTGVAEDKKAVGGAQDDVLVGQRVVGAPPFETKRSLTCRERPASKR